MTLTLIFLFILLGVFLIWLEFFIVPGITVAGIGGTVFVLGGIYIAYANEGRSTGHLVLLGAFVITAVIFYFSFRSKTWKKTALDTSIDSKIEGIKPTIKAGDIAQTVSRLAPMGKILIDGDIIEAKSKLGLIDENEKVKIVEVYTTNVLVERIEA